MESAGQALSAFNPSVFKEPRGFIKVLEFVLSIFAFATTTSPDSSTTFTVKNCTNTTTSAKVTFKYSYPYDLEDVCFKLPICAKVKTDQFCLLSGSQSSAQFYVFVGVIVFLYCLGALVLYVFFDELYRRNARVVIIDFVVSVVLTLLWIIASSAWAAGVSDIKMYTDPSEGGIFKTDHVPECKEPGACHTNSLGTFGSLNVSIMFGFLNFLVWVGNLWFLYKETSWFKGQQQQPNPPNAPGEYPSSGNVY